MTTADIQPELLPCPFCGGDNLAAWQPCTDGGHGIACRSCHLTLDARAVSHADAITAWNACLTSTTPTLGDMVMVPREPTEAWVHSLANWRQGQRDTPRCEPPGKFELDRARDDIAAVIRNAPASLIPTSVIGTVEREGEEYMSVSIDRDGNVTSHNAYDANFDEMVSATRAIIVALQQRLDNRLKCPFAAGKALLGKHPLDAALSTPATLDNTAVEEVRPLRIDWNKFDLAEAYDLVEGVRRKAGQPPESPISTALRAALEAIEAADCEWDGLTAKTEKVE